MNDGKAEITIGADGVNVEEIINAVKAKVAERRAAGEYDDARVARAERHNLLNLQDDDEFLENYLSCLRQIVPVDINDFEIFERRSRFAKPLIKLKRAIWTLLRFYTYRLWSQQNQTNAVLLAAVEMLNNRCNSRIKGMEAKISELEAKIRRSE